MNKIINWLKKLWAFKTSPHTMAEAIHFLLATLTILIAAHMHWRVWLAAVAIEVVALWLEVVADPYLEGDPFWPNGAIDVLFYSLGMVSGLIIVRL